ncbi:GNAT family N-acetyltransferase [Flavobacteriaceae bacterium 3-367]|uniref:GNAT family N-acetyltransferase n=1 Tax=Eudoraea algarum TaxID=3417568 RepID=UPI00326C4314
MHTTTIIEVTPENVREETLFCVKDLTNPGFKSKEKWFGKRYREGLRMKILKESGGKSIGFIEYVPASKAWRPVQAENYMFIHCMYVYAKKDREKGYGSLLIKACEKEAKQRQMAGVCVMASKGAWIASDLIFIKNGFDEVDQKGRFQLLAKTWDTAVPAPKLLDWTTQQKQYTGWHLVYADQCPWHEKSVEALLHVAHDYEIDLKITKLNSPEVAKNAPSGYGVFSLLHDGKLIEDHYLSATRFKNILKKELGQN